MKRSFRKFYIVLFWVLITLIVLYDRRFLIQKIGLGHFAECTVVRVGLLMALSYLNLNVLMPRLLERGRVIVYAVLLGASIAVYIYLQQLYDVYLYGLVLGDQDSRTLGAASTYLIFTTVWYLILTIVFYKALEWYEQKKQVEGLEEEIRQLKEKESMLVKEEDSSEMFIKSGTKKVRIDRDAITYVQGLKDYAILYTSADKLIVKGTLKSVEEMFPSGMLVRIHKSYLVARKKVSSVSSSKVMLGSQPVPVGRSYRENAEKIML
ncbi:MAG: LytTR family transcriptional regulator [Cyclobacteriaceae bacterium]|nr:LytTR family transcriptional regulator [Cyclobacteriaceae bacterium]